MDGYPKAPIVLRPILWIMKVASGKHMLQKILESKSMRAGGPTMPATVHAADGSSDELSVNKLCDTVDRFDKFKDAIHESPLFGKMNYATAKELQLIHCAHHFSFLIPKEQK